MSIVIGGGSASYPKALTLLQVIREGRPFPSVSHVIKIFLPGKVDCYTFLTEADYRVNVYRNTELFDIIDKNLAIWDSANEPLAIEVPDKAKADYQLLSTDESVFWTGKPYGFEIEIQDKKRARKGKHAS